MHSFQQKHAVYLGLKLLDGTSIATKTHGKHTYILGAVSMYLDLVLSWSRHKHAFAITLCSTHLTGVGSRPSYSVQSDYDTQSYMPNTNSKMGPSTSPPPVQVTLSVPVVNVCACWTCPLLRHMAEVRRLGGVAYCTATRQKNKNIAGNQIT